MIVLGIDPGTLCGWALLEPFDVARPNPDSPAGKLLASGRWDLKPHQHEGAGMRFVRLQAYLRQLLDAHGFALAFYEQPGSFGGRSKGSPEVVHGVVATAAAWLERRKIPYRGLPFATSKRLMTGRGNATKIEMCRAVRRVYGAELYAGVRKRTGHPDEHDDRRGRPGDEDEADAIAVAHAGAVELGGIVP